MSKPFKVGIVVGRFQPLHKGHELIINKLIDMCETPIVVIGSAQEGHTKHNPFDYKERAQMLTDVFGDKIVILPIIDRPNIVNDPSWTEYLLNKLKRINGYEPELIVMGNDLVRGSWFDDQDQLYKLVVPRTKFEISGTKLREMILKGERDFFEKRTNEALHPYYGFIKNRLEEVEKNEI